MAEIGSAETSTGRTAALWVERAWIGAELRAFDVIPPIVGKDRSGAPHSRRRYAIEQIHPSANRFNEVFRESDAHEVSRPVARERFVSDVERGVHRMFGFADRQSPDCVAEPIVHIRDRGNRFLAEVRVRRPLNDGEERLRTVVDGFEFGECPTEPADAAFHGVTGGGFIRLAWSDVIELHHYVGAEIALHPHDRFGGEKLLFPVDVAAKLHAVFGDGTQRFEREDLKSAGVCEDRAVPSHKIVQPAQLTDEFVGWAEVEMVRIGENHRRTHVFQLHGIERFDRCLCSHGHEHRRFDRTVWCGERAGSSLALGAMDCK